MRTVLKLPFDTRSYFLGAVLEPNHIVQQLQLRSIRFLYNMYQSKNAIVRSYFNHAILDVIVLALNLLFYGLWVLIFLSRSYVILLSMFHKLELL